MSKCDTRGEIGDANSQERVGEGQVGGKVEVGVRKLGLIIEG